jgi:hypothetical protein
MRFAKQRNGAGDTAHTLYDSRRRRDLPAGFYNDGG